MHKGHGNYGLDEGNTPKYFDLVAILAHSNLPLRIIRKLKDGVVIGLLVYA
jgi:hypothetical protein